MPSNSQSGKPSENEIYKAAWLNNILQAFFLLNKSGLIIDYNSMAERLVKEIAGKKLKEGDNFSEILFPKKSQHLSEELQKAEKGKHLNGELKEQDAKGNDRWFTYSITPVKESGKVSVISFGLIEITDQKISESELEERNKEQKCLYDIARLDEMNLSIEQLIRKVLKLLPEGFQYPELTEAVITYSGKKYETENYKASKPKLTAVSDRTSEHLVKIEIVSNKKGKETGVGFLNEEKELIEAVADLLSLKFLQIKTRRDLQIGRERFEYALKASDDVIYDHDMVADTISISENFQNIFGYSFEGKPFTLEKWATLIHPDDEEVVNSRLSKALTDKSNSKWEAEFRYAKKDGTYVNVKENAYIIRDDSGKPVRMIGTLKDITKSKHRELKKDLSSNISRKFNESDTLKSALNMALFEIITLGKFKFAEIWLVNHDRSAIELSSYIEKNNEQFYRSEVDNDSFKIGKGLPGKTWKSGKIQFWKNLDTRKSFIRREGAAKSDLKTGYGFPVIFNNEVSGVLLLGTDENLQKPQPFAEILEELAKQLGEEIHRKNLEEELSRIFSSAPDGIIVAGFDGFLKKVNPAMSEILGYSEKELLNTPFIEFIHPDDKERTLQFYEEANSGTEKSHFENRYITKSGQVVWLSWTFKVFHEEELTYSVAKNITEQKELELLFNQTNRLAKIGSWEVDLVEEKVYWSDMTREILGVGPNVEPSLEKGLDIYKEGESRDKMSDAIQLAIEKGTPWDIEVKIVIEPGNEKWVRSIGEAELVQGKCVRVYGSLQDIHEKKELEELLEKANRLARIGSWEVDLIEEKVYWSDITREIHEEEPGFTPDLESGINYYKQGKSREIIRKAVEEILQNGTSWDLELPIITGKGNEKWIRTIGEAEFVEGKCVRIFGSFQDIHDRKVAEEELREKTVHIEAIAQINAALLNYRDWFGALDRHLGVVGEAVQADRVYYFENRFDSETGEGYTTQKLEWCREGIEAQLGNPDLDEIPFSEVPELVDPMIDRQHSTRKLSNVPKGSMTEYVMLDQQMKTFLAIPIYIKDHFHGFVGFDNCTEEKDWSDEEMTTLETIASNLATAIERQQADDNLQSAFKEKNTILESIGDAFFALDTNWTVTYWNHMAEEVLGMPREKIVGENLWDLYEDATSLKFYTEYHKAVKEQVTVHFEEFYPTVGKWFEVSAYPSESGLSVFFKDITERYEALRNIELSNERFLKVSEVSKDAIWDYDVKEQSLFWGEGFKKLFGYDPDDFGDKLVSWEEQIHGDDREQVVNSFKNTIEGKSGLVWDSEYRFLKADGEYAFIHDKGSVIRNENNEVIRVVGAMSDVTEQKETEEKLRRLNESLKKQADELAASNAELEQFAFVASHDLQEPLRMITGFLAQLERKYEDVLDEKGKKYIHFATDGARRMRQIILDLLNYSRVGRVDTDREEVDVNAIVDEAMLLNQSLLKENKAEVEIGKMPIINASKGPMRQLFQNLISNALKYHKSGSSPEVNIRAEETDDYWAFMIKDNGIGIDPEYSDKIFNIFQRLHGREEYSGSGVGLAICKKIVEDHGGTIWVESEVGKGSTFYFTIVKESTT